MKHQESKVRLLSTYRPKCDCCGTTKWSVSKSIRMGAEDKF